MTNKEYIRWLKLLDEELPFDGLVDGKDEMDMHEMIWELCEKLEQEPKTGHWIEKDGFDGDTYYNCSECGESWTTIDGTPWEYGMKFCPNCGARMERENKENVKR